MTRSRRFIGLDTIMVDVVVTIASLPLRGGDQVATERLVSAGGGFNAMSAAARQGLDVIYAGQLGSGPFADIARDALVREGIEVAVARIEHVDIGLCFVLVERDGERTFVTSPGAEGLLTAKQLGAVALQAGDVVFMSGYDFVYPALCAETMSWLRSIDQKVIVAFDPGPRVMDIPEPVRNEVLDRTDWFLCNETEAVNLSQQSDVGDAARWLATRTGRRGVVVRCGPDGCYLATNGAELVHVKGVQTTVVDTNGAGDVHNGVFLAESLRGTDTVESLQRANVAASIAIGLLGPATCPHRDVVSQRFVEAYAN